MKKVLCLALLACSAQYLGAEQPDGNISSPRFYGYLRYDAETFTQSGGPMGLYSIDVVKSARVTPVNLEVGGNGGGCYADGKYYVVEYAQNKYGELTSVKLIVYNPQDWSVISEREIPQTSIPTTMTYNPVDNQIYGCFFNNDSDKMEFAVLNTQDGTTDVIKVMDVSISTLACDHKGVIYAINALGDLMRYDHETSDFTTVGATGLVPKYIQDATFDFGTKQLYWFAMTADEKDAGIYNVDLATGAASRITEYATGEKEFTGVFSMTPLYSDDVPDLVTDCSINIEAGTNQATASFRLPSATYSGAPIAGTLSYRIEVDGATAKTGEAQAGDVFQTVFEIPNGEKTISIKAGNTAGMGPEFIIRQFVGFDQPVKVEDVVAVRCEDGVRISWAPISTGVHGLPVNTEEMSYRIVRMPDNIELASFVKETEFVDSTPVEEAAPVAYEVTATDGVSTSEASTSNQVIIGPAQQVPFAYDFRDKPGLGLFTIIDNNNDGSTWMFRDKYGILCMYGRVTADDWLITPPLNLEGGHNYKVTASIGVAMDPEKFEIKYGRGALAGDMTHTVVEPTEINSDNAYYRDVWDEPGNIVAYVTPEVSGEYHFGVHAITEPGALFLYCCDIAIEDAESSSVGLSTFTGREISIYSETGRIIVAGASNVEVYSVSGVCVASHSVKEEASVTLSLEKGIYVVRADGVVRKVIVK